ncbi:dynamin family protein [Falsibacillus albus]|uniref:GTP-binding protein n=1 Tax=Falsibacillus albus TaxID=2478915 RepID=A0A3L7JVE4_9BACI|nr:dynamin family protein [Falsibacillus albus]RLQ94827.1 GTP-binding protein [Falsibacillus albus]
MSDFQKLLKAKVSMDHSPLKKLQKSAVAAPVIIDHKLFNDESRKMDKLIENMDSSLKVVIMGEVKAGKSTLLNSFAGRNISPMDISEATGSIIEIKYHPEPYGKIILRDSIIEDKPDKIFDELQNNNNNQEFFKTCEGIEFGFPISNLKDFTLVDTPGLETITEDNSNRTKEYIAKTDVVIWVFNGHHLGQADVEEALIEVNRFGKPIIAVINRIDEIDEDPEVLIDYLDDEIGMFVEEIIAVSAFKANNAVLSGDDSLLTESGFQSLLEYIGDNISSNSEQVKKDVVINSAQVLLNRDLLIHEEYIKTIEFLQAQMEEIKNKVKMSSSRIHDNVLYQFENWYQNEFLSDEAEELKNIIKQSGYFQLKNDKKEVECKLQSIFSEENINNKLSERIKDMDKTYINEWKVAVDKIKREIQVEINDFKIEAEKELELKLKHNNKLNDGDSDFLSGASKGALLGGATGAASAFYAAALGPAAATVTAGMALSAFMPPMLLIGGTIGVVSAALKFKSEKSMAEKNIDDIFKNAKQQFKKELFNSISEKYVKQDEQILEKIDALLINSFANGVSTAQIVFLKMKLEKYLFEVKKHIEELKLIEV